MVSSKEKEGKSEDVCEKCGGKHYILKKVKGSLKRVKCDCQKVEYKLSQEPKEISEEELKGYIPSEYFLRTEFDEELLEQGIKEGLGEELSEEYEMEIEEYVGFLGDYIGTIELGLKPDRSYFIVAPPKFGKKIFAYNVIKKGRKKGLKVSRIYDTQEIYGIMDNRDTQSIIEIYREHDLVILNVGNSPNKQDVIGLRNMMGLAETWGKAIIVLSRYTRGYFSKIDPYIQLDLGVKSSKRGVYGELEQVGFGDDLSQDYKRKIVGESKEKYLGNEIAKFKEEARKERENN